MCLAGLPNVYASQLASVTAGAAAVGASGQSFLVKALRGNERAQGKQTRARTETIRRLMQRALHPAAEDSYY